MARAVEEDIVTATPDAGEEKRNPWLADGLASCVVFLVALPLCIGIAVACGVPPERGLITGIIGGLVVGSLAGSPLLVSGPAASLIVLVYELVATHGLAALGPVVMLAGLWQVLAGAFGLGQWFRAVAPAVISGMLFGIGVLITASQLHVAIDSDPVSSFAGNLQSFAVVVVERIASGPGLADVAPLVVGASTIAMIALWNKWRPAKLALVPGQLVALAVVMLAVSGLALPVRFLDVSPRFFAGLAVVSFSDLKVLTTSSSVVLSLVFAFVASAATLLTAAAIDQRQTHARTNYNKEMMAQGVGNMLTGGLGGLPMTGVIVRSSVNVDAGARTRRSTILHGLWILLFVSVAPQALALIPRAALGGILVFTGVKLADPKVLRELYTRGRGELAVGLITLGGVVFIDLFDGIMIGFAAAMAKLLYTFSHLEVRSEPDDDGVVQHVHLSGAATFLRLPLLAEVLENVPVDREVHVHIDELDYIDHACLELLSQAHRVREGQDGPRLVVEWSELTHRSDRAFATSRKPEVGENTSLLRVLWREWKQVNAPRAEVRDHDDLPSDWIHPSRIQLALPATSLEEVVAAAARMLAPSAGAPEAVVAGALREHSVGGWLALGEGVGVPHAAISGLDRPLAALITTPTPVVVGEDHLDIFFVLLAPVDHPRLHLIALAHIGRLCHDHDRLRTLREVTEPADALEALRAGAIATGRSGVATVHAS